MDTAIASSLLAILLFAVLGCADAYGTVQYFNVSKTRVQKGEVINFKCGTTLQEMEGGQAHSLIVHIKKWFPGARGWQITTNENFDADRRDHRFSANLRIIQENGTREIQQIREVDFTIAGAETYDSGNYTCYTSRNNMSTFVDVVAEPYNIELYLDGVMVGQTEVDPVTQQPLHVKMNEEVNVVLKQSYMVSCDVEGGNPPPAVRLSGGNTVYPNVLVTQTTQRNPENWMSEPNHQMNATMTWKATVQNIGMPVRCEASVEDPEPVFANFIPVVADMQPLFDCVDKVVASSNEENLAVTCRIISMKGALHDVSVRVYVGDEKNFTISVQTGQGHRHTEHAYPEDQRYVLSVTTISTRFTNATFTIKDARRVADLYKHKLEFMAENQYDITEHVVIVEAEGPSSASRMTISMAAVLLTMVLGAFY